MSSIVGNSTSAEAQSVGIHIFALDPVSFEGVATQLRREEAFELVGEADLTAEVIVVVVADRLDGPIVPEITRLRHLKRSPMVLVADFVDDAILLRATELGFAGIVRRGEATGPILAAAVRAVAAGDGALPPDLVGRLLGVMERLHSRVLAPRGLTAYSLTEREIMVLRLVADGLDTAQIASQLSYSERTIKDILHQLTMRLQLRNRTHAVAFAIREGLL
jgi:DNA-binding NarL/FixJ family response regulator